MKGAPGALVAALSIMAGSAPSLAEYPTRPVRLVINFPAGGPSDAIGRTLAQKASQLIGQPVVLDFRPGAAGNIGADHVAKAAPDGYTILLISGSFFTNPAVAQKLPFDPLRDFAPITPAANGGMVLVTHPSVPARTMPELIALAKKHPGKLTFGSSGRGGSLHLNAELLKLMAGIDLLHVPYKGAGPALIEVVGGMIDMMFIALPPTLPHIEAKRLRAIGVASAKRSPSLPGVATISESAVPGFEISSHFGVVAPAATSPAMVGKLNAALVQALTTTEVRQRYASLGVEPITSTPQAYGAFIRAQISRWAEVVKAAQLKPQ